MDTTQDDRPEKLLLSVADAVYATGLSRSLIYEKIATGEIGSVKVGTRRLITPAALDAFVASLSA